MVRLWWTCGDGVANSNIRFGRLVVISWGGICGDICSDIYSGFYHTKHFKYKAIFATFMNSQNRYLLGILPI